MKKTIITVATTGAWPKKENNPNVPMTPAEIAEDVYACWKAGAAMAHLHMRDDAGNGTMDKNKFRQTVELLRKNHPECDIILNMTTSGDLNATDETRQAHLEELRRGHAIECPVYDFTIHNRSEQTIHIVPKKVIIVEGILIFENEELRNLMDIRIFVDTDADIRLCRRIKRDVNKRGRTLESVLKQYQDTVKPMHERYVEPSKKYANIVVPEGGKNLVALDMIIGRIQRHLEEA